MLKHTGSERAAHPLPSVRALCGDGRDVARPPLPVDYLHDYVPVVAAVTCAEGHDHGHGEADVGSVPNVDPDHSADQLLRAGHHQAAQGVGRLASQGSGRTLGCSDEARVWHIWITLLLFTGESRDQIHTDSDVGRIFWQYFCFNLSTASVGGIICRWYILI